MPTAIRVPEAFVPFLCEGGSDIPLLRQASCKAAGSDKHTLEGDSTKLKDSVDAVYEVQLLEEPLQLTGKSLVSRIGMEVYPYNDGWLRVYTPLTAEDGCQVACFSRANGKHVLYYPAFRWAHYSAEWNCLHLMGIEEFLIQHEALLLHSSVVQLHGQTVLFSGPSGIGKSTQASLWKQYLGADILNGDRCIIRKKSDGFYGCGSPWCGTSAIYRKEQAPIKGIFLLGQSKENTVKRAGAAAFARLFQQCIVNQWNRTFVVKLTDLLVELLEQVPVYELNCRPDEAAVGLAYNALFEDEACLAQGTLFKSREAARPENDTLFKGGV